MKKILLASGAIIGMSMPAIAQDGAGAATTASVYACAEIGDDTERLACFDAAVGRLKQAEETGEVVTVTRDQVKEVERDSFGFNLPSLPKLVMPKLGGGDQADGLDEVVVAAVKVSSSAEGKALITLENGQIWVQTDSANIRVKSRDLPMDATIRKAAFSSYRMQLGNGRWFRAKRLQ